MPGPVFGFGDASSLKRDDNTMGITITEKAAVEMNRALTEKNLDTTAHVLRIAVAGGGCSGFEYRLAFDEACNEETDDVSTQHGLTVAVDHKSMPFLEGTTIDWYDGLEKRGFTFENPNAEKTCGCGTSFSC